MIHVPTHAALHYAFDGLAWIAGSTTGLLLYRWRLRDAATRTAAVAGRGYFVALALGGVLGAWLAGSFNTLRSDLPVLSHSIAGALGGAIVGVEVFKLLRGVRGSTGGVFAGPFAIGVAVGRWGCLFAGLPDRTYGMPTGVPWVVDLGDGIGRHPVQAYEALSMTLYAAIYVVGLARRAPWAMKRGFYVTVAIYGAQRFVWEFLKPYPSLIGPFNVFHMISAGLILYGIIFYGRDLARERRDAGAQERAVSILRPDHEPL